jgi:hypothetical protein
MAVAVSGTVKTGRPPWMRLNPIPGACITRRATYGNGYRTAIIIITRELPKTVRPGRSARVNAAGVWSAAVPGMAYRRTYVPRRASGTSLAPGPQRWFSSCPGLLTFSLFSFTLCHPEQGQGIPCFGLDSSTPSVGCNDNERGSVGMTTTIRPECRMRHAHHLFAVN